MKPILTLMALWALMTGTALAQSGYYVESSAIHERYVEDAQDYGQRDIDQLVETLREDVTQSLDQAGLLSSDGLAISLIINDAKPNRPTMEQMSDNPSLSYQSFSRGGADITAIIHDATGRELSRFQYDWYTREISDAAHLSTWSDADRAISRFASRLADHVRDLPNT